ncbi:8-amino-7-oxononanoate synthase [Novosphingobium lentum]|uniref:8-amino-7-oxononanoate synthase n=1 Tax=Novosphingobium lentum TaxID=145287 RepID=UPI00082DB96D|nr:8-amino-7-oxononanoate synthase [Novosphingobium lentum]
MSDGAGPFAAQADDLARLDSSSRRRRLVRQAGVDFASNDYLGLRASGLLADAARAALDSGVPLGSGGSRLLGGNHPEHEALEADAAAFFGSESALCFSTGYAANSALLATLPQRGDLIVHDELVHASAHEGIRLGRAHSVSARHNDVGHVEDVIAGARATGFTGRAWIAVESLYSMDGDRAPLADLLALADRHDAVLLIDEAHATGVFGNNGRGLADSISGRDNVITLRTFGKALGCEGAVVCGPAVVRDFLVNRARQFIFSTAPSPLMAAVARAALGIVRDEPMRRTALWERISAAERVLSPLGGVAHGSQILPVIIGEDAPTMALAARLQAAGLDVRGIRPPTVPEGTSRLRVSITLNASVADIERLGATLAAGQVELQAA